LFNEGILRTERGLRNEIEEGKRERKWGRLVGKVKRL